MKLTENTVISIYCLKQPSEQSNEFGYSGVVNFEQDGSVLILQSQDNQ